GSKNILNQVKKLKSKKIKKFKKYFYNLFVICFLILLTGCVPGNVRSNFPKFLNINVFAGKKTNYLYNVFSKEKPKGSLIITEEFKKENNIIKYKLSGEYKKENSLIVLFN
ncbi:MAG: hypothetical protein QW273_03005, partial [Candidatus Pacearchaeota archaeon]